MKKILVIVLIAAGMTACNSNADHTNDTTTVDSDSATHAPGAGDTATLRTDTSGPRPDSVQSR